MCAVCVCACVCVPVRVPVCAGLGTLPMQSPELAVQELKRCMTIGLAGVEVCVCV